MRRLAFGISAIGEIGSSYVQNVGTLDEYYALLDAQTLPVLRGIVLDYAAVESAHGIRFGEYFGPEIAALETLAADGLVDWIEGGLVVTPRGRLLLRIVAIIFDRYLREQRDRARYSRVI